MNRTTTVVVALVIAASLTTMVYALPEQRALAWGGGFGGCGFGCGGCGDFFGWGNCGGWGGCGFGCGGWGGCGFGCGGWAASRSSPSADKTVPSTFFIFYFYDDRKFSYKPDMS